MSMKKKVIIFDLDGVLVDSTQHVLNFFLDTYPTLTKEKMDEMLTGNFHTEVEKFKRANKPIVETDEQRMLRNKHYSERKAELPLFVGISELLQALDDAGHTLVINTSALEKNCLPLLVKAGIRDMFDFIATKEISIDKAEKFQIISKRYSVPMSNMIFVTDTLGDVREADNVGVPTIAVTYGAHSRSFFEREHHDNIIKIANSVEDLRDYLLFEPKMA